MKNKIRKPAKFRSNAEKLFAKYLRKNGIKYEYEAVKIEYEINRLAKYTPDFKMKHGILIEFKGRFTSSDRVKMLRIKQQHPGLDLRIVFQQNKRLYKGSLTYYSDWAFKYGFKHHVGISLPQDWIEELRK